MNRDVKALWLHALRSGDYKQGKDALKRVRVAGATGETQAQYCCLGVLCELAVKADVIPDSRSSNSSGDWHYGDPAKEYTSWSRLPKSVMDWAGLTEPDPKIRLALSDEPAPLSRINDFGSSFETIADLIEEHL